MAMIFDMKGETGVGDITRTNGDWARYNGQDPSAIFGGGEDQGATIGQLNIDPVTTDTLRYTYWYHNPTIHNVVMHKDVGTDVNGAGDWMITAHKRIAGTTYNDTPFWVEGDSVARFSMRIESANVMEHDGVTWHRIRDGGAYTSTTFPQTGPSNGNVDLSTGGMRGDGSAAITVTGDTVIYAGPDSRYSYPYIASNKEITRIGNDTVGSAPQDTTTIGGEGHVYNYSTGIGKDVQVAGEKTIVIGRNHDYVNGDTQVSRSSAFGFNYHATGWRNRSACHIGLWGLNNQTGTGAGDLGNFLWCKGGSRSNPGNGFHSMYSVAGYRPTLGEHGLNGQKGLIFHKTIAAYTDDGANGADKGAFAVICVARTNGSNVFEEVYDSASTIHESDALLFCAGFGYDTSNSHWVYGGLSGGARNIHASVGGFSMIVRSNDGS
jgi:hypothetical protein